MDVVSLTEDIIDDPAYIKEKFPAIHDDGHYFANMICFVCKIKISNVIMRANVLFNIRTNELVDIQEMD